MARSWNITGALLAMCFLSGCGVKKAQAPTPTATLPPSRTATAAAPSPAAAPATPRVGATASAPASSTVVSRAGTPGLITISATSASPETVAIQAGRQVTWLNADTAPHRIVSDEVGLFDTGNLAPNTSAVVSLTAAGTHEWHDPSFAAIKGKIRVIP